MSFQTKTPPLAHPIPKSLDLSTLSPLRRELLGLLACPETGSPLSGWDGLTAAGALSAETGGRVYPVRDGIPCLLPDDLQAAATAEASDTSESAEKHREMTARDAQADDYDRMMGLKLFTALELPLSVRYLAPVSSDLMLEGGSGTGRMTARFAESVRGLIALDFSHASLRAAQKKLPPHLAEKTLFIQADLTRLPLRHNAFERVGSFGVYEHLPTPDARSRALSQMKGVLKPGGRFAFSAYRWGFPQSLMSAREGHHDGGIYFRRFSAPEIRALLAEHFEPGGHTEILSYYHLLWGRRRNDSDDAEGK